MPKFKDLTGKRFGRLLVLKKGQGDGEKTYWECQCNCGNTKGILAASLLDGRTKSCGCLRRELLLKDVTNMRFGKLTAIRPVAAHNGRARWECKCDCGNIKHVTIAALNNGTTRSCGCLRFETIEAKRNQRNNDKLLIFRYYLRNLWAKRKTRKMLSLPIDVTAEDLKAQWDKQRGICPYSGWVMTHRTKGCISPFQASVDRIDSSGGYVPGNIQFVTLMANYAKNSFDDYWLIEFGRSVAKKHSSTKIVPMTQIEDSLAAMDECNI